jgi:hypothetical protein
MKKIICSLILLAFISGATHAQVRFDFGLKGGLNFASVNNLSTTNLNATYGNRTGYHVGAYAMIKVTKLAIQPEILFSRQGQNFSVSNLSNLNSNLDYINIPIILKLYLLGGLNLQAGPQFGFLYSSRGDVVTYLQGSVFSANSADLKSFVKSSDLSLSFGAGWDLPLGLNLTARYNWGLTDINQKTGEVIPPNGASSSLGTQEAKNQVVQLSIGYRLFKLGK